MMRIIRLFDLMLINPRKDFIGGLIGGALGLAGSLFSGKKNRDAAASAQQAQIDFEKYKMANYHQYQVEDLRKAGLNPILSSHGSTPVGSPAGAFGTQDNPGTAAANSAMAFQQMRLQARQQKNQDLIAESQVDLNSARAEKERADAQYRTQEIEGDYVARQIDQMTASAAQSRAVTQNLKKQSDIIDQDLRKGAEELKNLISYRDRLEAETHGARTRAVLDSANIRVAAAERELKEELRRKYAVDTALARLDYSYHADIGGRYGGRTPSELVSGVYRMVGDVSSELNSYVRNLVSSPTSVSSSRILREGSDK